MKLERLLDKLHDSVVSTRLLQIFTAFVRILLGVGFIYPSIPKIMNRPFTSLPDSDPVGHYFNALHQTGYYYEFIGWSQITAAILLLIPRTSHIGALIFFPIILNITVLTNSVGFKGTWLLTIFMSLASLYLVCWDYDRWKPILFGKGIAKAGLFNHEFIWLPALFSFGGTLIFLLASYLSLGNIDRTQYRLLMFLAAAGLVFGFAVAAHHKFMRIGKLQS
ncbi:MAG: DoxX family protein [Acidobacteria bacterium]|nr:DoxX family protein [Acidobacteriota bacterium]